MVFGRKSKMAIQQQQMQLAALQAQIRNMQSAHTNVPMAAPTEIHHHTREIVNNVPQYIAVPMAEAATFVAPPAVPMAGATFVNQFAEPALPLSPLAAGVEAAPAWGPMTPMTPATPVAECVPAPVVEYLSHTQHLDGTWEHNRWWE